MRKLYGPCALFSGMILLLLSGCASEVDRLNRLQLEEAIAYGTVLRYQQAMEALHDSLGVTANAQALRCSREISAPGCAQYSALMDSLGRAEDRLTLARRTLNRFLR